MHAQSRKSGLLAPTPLEIVKLAERSRRTSTRQLPDMGTKPLHPFLKRRLTAEVIATIVARRKRGEKASALCEEYGISESGLNDLLTRAEVPVRTAPITTEDIDAAVQLYESGLTVKQVVRELGYSIRTIRRVLHERDVTMRKSGWRRAKQQR